MISNSEIYVPTGSTDSYKYLLTNYALLKELKLTDI